MPNGFGFVTLNEERMIFCPAVMMSIMPLMAKYGGSGRTKVADRIKGTSAEAKINDILGTA